MLRMPVTKPAYSPPMSTGATNCTIALGVPIRRYRQWHRLFVTAVGVTQGLSLTTAALEAGFTDSAHFSRTFRSILGMPPSAMLNPRGRMRMFAG